MGKLRKSKAGSKTVKGEQGLYYYKGASGTIYESDFRVKGERYHESWNKVTLSVAKNLHRKFRIDVLSGEHQKKQEQKKKNVDFEDFVVKYLKDKELTCKPTGYDYYVTSLKPITRFFIGKKLVIKVGKDANDYRFIPVEGAKARIKYLSDINPFMIQQFKHERKKDTVKGTGKAVSNCAVNKSIKCLRNVFNMAKKLKMLKENPAEEVELLKEKPKEVVILSREKEVEFYRALANNPKA